MSIANNQLRQEDVATARFFMVNILFLFLLTFILRAYLWLFCAKRDKPAFPNCCIKSVLTGHPDDILNTWKFLNA